MQDGRSALSSLLSADTHAELIAASQHGINDGGISLYTPSGSVLFSLRRYIGEQPQFVHRHVLKRILEHGEDVDVRRGVSIAAVGAGSGPDEGDASERSRVEVRLSDGSSIDADLVVGEYQCVVCHYIEMSSPWIASVPSYFGTMGHS